MSVPRGGVGNQSHQSQPSQLADEEFNLSQSEYVSDNDDRNKQHSKSPQLSKKNILGRRSENSGGGVSQTMSHQDT